MSDLHKAFMRRAKAAGPSGPPKIPQGLGVLAEDTTEQNEPVTLKQLSQEILEEEEEEDEDQEGGDSCSNDTEIRSLYSEFVSSFFSKTETYRNDSSSIQTYYQPPSTNTAAIFVCLHGAGSSALTYGKFAQELRKQDDTLGFFAYDIRGHGNSTGTSDYSLDALVQELGFVMDQFKSRNSVGESPIYYVGHSLGGAIMAKYLSLDPQSHIDVRGFIMLDIVEETAVRSLSAMPSFISNRPKVFKSLKEAINWHMNFLLFNEDSAILSIPDLLNPDLTWKTDLSLTQPYWDSWFAHLSGNFLKFKGPKLLILSTHETLDKDLIVGQMQGKYQLVVFNNNNKSGHFIHEDLPNQITICILDFLKRNETPNKFIRENLGIVPKWGGKINK